MSDVDSMIELHGDRIRLRTTTETDRTALVAIRSTAEVHARWRGDALDEEFTEDLADDETHRLTIENEEATIIGLIQFGEEDDPEYRHASIDIYLDPTSHRRGYGHEAITTLVNYLFDARSHHRLTIDPAADNQPAIACYRKVGFAEVGVLRQYERQSDGRWADGLFMEMLADDRRT